MPPDRRIGDILDDPVARLQRDMVFEQQLRGRRVDAQHRRLGEIEPGRERDRIRRADAATLGPILALHVDDEVAGFDMSDAGADRGDPADAFRAGGRRQCRVQPVIAAAERQIGRVDRKRQHVEHDLARAGHSDIRRLDAFGHHFRGAIGGDLDLLHRHVLLGIAAGSALCVLRPLAPLPLRMRQIGLCHQ